MYDVVNYLDDAQLESLKAYRSKLTDKANKEAVEVYKASKNVFKKAITCISDL